MHAAAGGTGSGALVLGKALGARVIATAGSDEKVAFCKELGADHAINYRNGDWVEQVMELTYGRGVDVAFDAVGGDVAVQTFRAMGLNGRYLMAGFAQDIALEDGDYLSPRPIAYSNFDVCGVCLVYVNDPVAIRRTLGFNWRHARRDWKPMRRSWSCCVPGRSVPSSVQRSLGPTCRMPWSAWPPARPPAAWWSAPAITGNLPGSKPMAFDV